MQRDLKSEPHACDSPALTSRPEANAINGLE